MFGLTSKQRNATKMVCYSQLNSSLMSAEIKPKLILVTISVTLWTVMPFWACLRIGWIFNGIHSNCGLEVEKLVSGNTPKNVQMSLLSGGGRGSGMIPKCPYLLCPYYGGEGGGPSK